MSIETDLGRIATALETIAKHVTADKQQATTAAAPTASAKKKPAPAATPAEAEAEADPFNNDAADEVTQEALTEVLKKHAKAFGTKTTIAVMQKHGADKVTPKIANIPTANYAKCFAEAEADLKKQKA